MSADPILAQAMREGDTVFVSNYLHALAVAERNERMDAELEASKRRLRIVILTLLVFFVAAFSIAR